MVSYFVANMYPKPIQNLIDLFTKFPGIGPRQASRFVFYILKEGGLAGDFVKSLQELQTSVIFCELCFRSVEKERGGICVFCMDKKRDQRTVVIVEKESDLQNLERTGALNGLYHVLGGTISPLDPNSPKNLHLRELHKRVKNLLEKGDKCEVILATSATTEGDTTALYIERILAPLKTQYQVLKISRLGRGLSLGSELEYADEVTLKSALCNRK